MNASFWSFSKKKNSTARPTGTGTVVDIKLKDDVSILTPIFTLQSSSVKNCNYFLWNGRYYFVDDFVYNSNDLYEVHGTIDVLATYKSEIGNYTCYVERCADVNHYDDMVSDNVVVKSRNIININNGNVTMPGWIINHEPACLLKVICSEGTSIYYKQSKTGIQNLMKPFMPTATDVSGGGQAIENLFNDFWTSAYKPLDYILDAYMLPNLPSNNLPSDFIATQGSLQFGLMSTISAIYGANSYVAYSDYLGSANNEVTLTIPSSYYNDFRAYDDNWTSYMMYIPSIGFVNIPAEYVQNTLKLSFDYNYLSGDIVCRLIMSKDGDSIIIGNYTGNVKCPVQIGALQSNAINVLTDTASTFSSGLNAVVGGFTGNPLQVVSGASGVVENGLSAFQNYANPGAVSKGNTSGNIHDLLNHHQIVFSTISYESKAIPTIRLGRPCCKNLQLNNLSGYIKCNGASVSISGIEQEKNMINNYLNGGFYYE
ncbi:MAG: hypothetical protein J6S67_17445 [Methanobrevibacter sp.]|nr:hypothetical protein [Methanobrevibacter sp.]